MLNVPWSRRCKRFAILFIVVFGFNIIIITRKNHQQSSTKFKTLETKWQNNKSKIVVLAVTGPPLRRIERVAKFSQIFHFYLPITIAAWRRLDFATLVIVIGDREPWYQKGHYLNYVMETIHKRLPGSAQFHFIQIIPTKWIDQVQTARVIRLFASFLEPLQNLTNSSYLITADVDTWPLQDIYSLPNSSFNMRISLPYRRNFTPIGSNLSIGWFHFSSFVSFLTFFSSSSSEQYRLASHGMSIGMWQDLMNLDSINVTKNWAQTIENYAKSENLLAHNLSYHLDQNLISIREFKWFQNHEKCNFSSTFFLIFLKSKYQLFYQLVKI